MARKAAPRDEAISHLRPDYVEEEVCRYVRTYRVQGFSYGAIQDGLLRSHVPLHVAEKCISLDKIDGRVFMSKKAFVLVGVGAVIVMLLLVLLLNLFPSEITCDTSSDCAEGYSCASGSCVQSFGFTCEPIPGCEEGYTCYKCLE